MKNWLLVANGSRARILEETDLPGGYVHVADRVHPETRLKGEAITADRPGRAVHLGRQNQTGTSYAPHAEPHEHERALFARELADVLDQGVAAGRCAGLTLVASNPFLGELKACLGEQSRKCLLKTVAADYTLLDDAELARRLGAS